MSYRFDKLDHLVVRDKRRRFEFKHFEFRRKLLQSVMRDARLPLSTRNEAQRILANFPKNSRPSRVKSRCTATGRPRGLDRRLKRSRIVARQRILSGGFPGIGKASW